MGIAVAAGSFWVWTRRGATLGAPFEIELPAGLSAEALSAELVRLGLVRDPRLFTFYVRLTRAAADEKPGSHLVRQGLSPAALLARVTRSRSRPKVKLTIPEGFNQFQVAQRLFEREIASKTAFLHASTDPRLLGELGIGATSAEGYLFPATYDIFVDGDAAGVIRILARETFRRFQMVADRHPDALRALHDKDGWGMHEVVTLASIVQKEAGTSDEEGSIASVFYNRLQDASFRPRQMLQSDPTAGYGCLLFGDRLESCRGYTGSVTPAMLRDASNEYNTYKHPGLPPGPIANPSQSALEAVLAPPNTPYFFFVAGPGKRHVFSRTFAEHERAIGTAVEQVAAPSAQMPASDIDQHTDSHAR
ncbi:MAG TPA: endolytic transglycosylase MltG [Polyangiaceae bacterium]|nr:endolytic transglycosylase MltG [Polyangiaceae bacterium]